jgi:hypothetical protein
MRTLGFDKIAGSDFERAQRARRTRRRGEAEQKKVQWTFFPLSGRGRMPSPGFRAKQDSAAKKAPGNPSLSANFRVCIFLSITS